MVWEHNAKLVHESMQGPRVSITEEPLQGELSLVALFSRLFGFKPKTGDSQAGEVRPALQVRI